MTSLTNLPIDTLRNIVSFLPSNKDVAALSIQCRSLHSLCDMETRKKYRRIDIWLSDNSVDRAFNMLMDILKRPVLGRYVRHVGCWERVLAHNDFTEGEYQQELSKDEMRLLRNATRRAGFVDSEEERVINMLIQKSTSAEPAYEGY